MLQASALDPRQFISNGGRGRHKKFKSAGDAPRLRVSVRHLNNRTGFINRGFTNSPLAVWQPSDVTRTCKCLGNAARGSHSGDYGTRRRGSSVTIRRNVLLPSSGSKRKRRKQPAILVPAKEPGNFVSSWWRHHYVIPPKLLLTNRFYFQQTSGIHAAVGKIKGSSLSGRSPAPIADSFHVATIARKHRVLNLREINRNNTHTALAYVLTYYGWVSLIFFVVTQRNII
jgi:hypothetical protein